MTLAEMAVLISTELGVYDATSVALIKSYLNKNYNILWDKFPWIDTEMLAAAALPAGTTTLTMPDGMNRVISILATNLIDGDPSTLTVTSDARFLDPVDHKFIQETAPNLMLLGGYVKYYEERRPTGPISSEPVAHLRFYPAPVVDTSMEILGKATCPGLLNDSDFSAIRNIDSALMAYATANMLRRQRQYGKAEIQDKKGAEAEAVAWNLEQQQANQPRMTKATTVAGNSLAEMTDAVCMICGQWTPEYRLIIREFLRRNYQTLYDMFLWPESLVTVLMPYTGEQMVLPYYIDRVLAVRSPGNLRMTPADGTLLLDLSPTIFEETGDPVSYTTLTPVAAAVFPSTTSQLILASTSPVDTSNVAIRGEIIATGQEFEETLTLQGTTPVTSQFPYDVVLTVAKEITVGNVTINAAVDYGLLGQLRPGIREKKFQRLWLLPPLPEGQTGTMLVMGKRAMVPLFNDQDTPIITGVQNVLIAAAAADLFRKLEKHDMANAFQQKAAGATEVIKDKNRDQAANSPRFVPQIEPRSYVAGCTW